MDVCSASTTLMFLHVKNIRKEDLEGSTEMLVACLSDSVW